ncbi:MULTISPECIES: bifunctional nuclease family protein [unclassified Gordonia (in: high G+C Gram-positive bacteria)]|uniref:bifunctional nuclease family protein n=1 Tax=unclassified Gordonia (in: high G+C Gram-positive bacteria) TaxID=2657482 RepID=UPI001FFFFB27|nr:MULTISPECIES: bifunctional nuclease family protein [unclassified Gordonia (in: high G+C Gram-positive bacteria)]UQE76686.1 bifunctional nuclease family protein [Gordonia sp. PP30]
MGEMRVVGIRVDAPQNQPVLLLRETEGERYLAIWIGQSEAASIALQQRGIEPPRPLTHDLIVNLCAAFDQDLTQVRIVDMQEGTFYAEMVFSGGAVISARPSDAIAVAMRVDAPIVASDEVLADAGLAMPDEEAGGAGEVESQEELEAFREFLDQVSPEDFLGPDSAP